VTHARKSLSRNARGVSSSCYRCVCFALWALCAGCATTEPWQRETLARRDMQLSSDEHLAAGEQHALSYREGSSGGGAAKGGGCGCN
jgi:hypothetical protein